MRRLTTGDSELRAAAAGDADAFAAFYRRYAETAVRYLAARVSEPEQAVDLMAETFAAALLSVRRYEPRRDGGARSWILTIAHHKLVDSIRRLEIDRRAMRRLGIEPV